MNKREFHTTSINNDTIQPIVVFGIGIIPPDDQRELGFCVSTRRNTLPIGTMVDHEERTIRLPIRREHGTYEELRQSLHKNIDMVFDFYLSEGEFAPNSKNDC